MTSTSLVPTTDQVFALAERVTKSNILPIAYRGKPVDTAIAMLYGQEIGLPPFTAIQRIVVIDGKPALDAQGMAAVIRQAGHSLSGTSTNEKAEITGKRADTGDEITVAFTIEDAKRAGLAGRGNWTKYTADMLWARALSRLARRLFADCLMGFSYVPEELESVQPEALDETPAEAPQAAPPSGRVRTPPPTSVAVPEPELDANSDVVIDAEVLEAPPATSITQREVNGLRRLLSRQATPITADDEALSFVAALVNRELPSLKALTSTELQTLTVILTEQ